MPQRRPPERDLSISGHTLYIIYLILKMLCCDNDSEHCLCGCCHVTTGTHIIAVLKIIEQFLGLCAVVATYFYSQGDHSATPGHLVLTTIACGAAVFLYIGVKQGKPNYMLPYLVYKGFELLLCVLMVCIMVLVVMAPFDLDEYATKHSHRPNDNVRVYLAVASFLFGIYCAFEFWLFSVVRSCYLYLKDHDEDERFLPFLRHDEI